MKVIRIPLWRSSIENVTIDAFQNCCCSITLDGFSRFLILYVIEITAKENEEAKKTDDGFILPFLYTDNLGSESYYTEIHLNIFT